MRLFIAIFLTVFAFASSMDVGAASSVETRQNIDALPPSTSIDTSKLTNERYNPGERPWLVENSSGDVIAKDIYRAILIPNRKVLHVEYVDFRNQMMEVLADSVTLMTTKGPCKITKNDILCPE